MQMVPVNAVPFNTVPVSQNQYLPQSAKLLMFYPGTAARCQPSCHRKKKKRKKKKENSDSESSSDSESEYYYVRRSGQQYIHDGGEKLSYSNEYPYRGVSSNGGKNYDFMAASYPQAVHRGYNIDDGIQQPVYDYNQTLQVYKQTADVYRAQRTDRMVQGYTTALKNYQRAVEEQYSNGGYPYPDEGYDPYSYGYNYPNY